MNWWESVRPPHGNFTRVQLNRLREGLNRVALWAFEVVEVETAEPPSPKLPETVDAVVLQCWEYDSWYNGDNHAQCVYRTRCRAQTECDRLNGDGPHECANRGPYIHVVELPFDPDTDETWGDTGGSPPGCPSDRPPRVAHRRGRSAAIGLARPLDSARPCRRVRRRVAQRVRHLPMVEPLPGAVTGRAARLVYDVADDRPVRAIDLCYVGATAFGALLAVEAVVIFSVAPPPGVALVLWAAVPCRLPAL